MTKDEYDRENLVGMEGECYLVSRLPSDFYDDGKRFGDDSDFVCEGRVALVDYLPAIKIFIGSEFSMGEIVEVRIRKKEHPLNTKLEFLKASLRAAKEMLKVCQEDLKSKTAWEKRVKELEEQIANYEENK